MGVLLGRWREVPSARMRRLRILVGAVGALARDPRVPRPLRWLSVMGLLPVPGPFDEAVALIALGLIAAFWRPALQDVRARMVVDAGDG